MKITIERHCSGDSENIEYDYEPHFERERPMALDVLLQAQERQLPDLAYRYGCRNVLCGVCTIEVNGKPKLACRTKVREGDRLSALRSLPTVKDLVVRRDAVNKQLLGRLPYVELDKEQTKVDSSSLHSLNRCIECYACLNDCKNHAKNKEGEELKYGNPYSFLKIQKIMVDPYATKQQKKEAVALAKDLGIEDYDTSKVPGCGVGIDLKKEVLIPLKLAAVIDKD